MQDQPGDDSAGDTLDAAAHRERRALVTRPRDDARALAEALARRHVEAVIEPLLDIRYLDGPMPDLAGVQAVLCTSANGVRALARLSPERGLPLLAVGDATASEARGRGFRAVASAGGTVADLARLATRLLRPAGGRLLHVAGRAVAGDLAGALAVAGFAVDRAVLYEARPAAALGAETVRLLRQEKIDFALFLSPRTATIFARLALTAGLGAATGTVTAIALSAAADEPLAGLAWHRRLVAARPDQDSLLQALDRALGDGGSR
ncbi:MAG: uroporphyrinogen-III synthase [Thiohalocapsa sp.]